MAYFWTGKGCSFGAPYIKPLRHLQDARRAGPMHKHDDPRVDVCIYFIAPHRIKKVDIKFMTELAKHVPVVPVLAKVR